MDKRRKFTMHCFQFLASSKREMTVNKRQPHTAIKPLHLVLTGVLLAALVLLGTALGVMPLSVTRAADFTVTTLDDENGTCGTGSGCSLREAIAEATAGQEIDFSVTGTITLTNGELTINKNLTITGPGAGSLAISGGGIYRVLHVYPGITLNLTNITITNGNAGGNRGGGINNEGTLNISNSDVFSNTAASGGGIYNEGTVDISNSDVFSNKTTAGPGGGICTKGTLVDISDCTISGNTAHTSGGGIYNEGALNISDNSTVSGNEATTVGGGLYNFSGTVDISNSTFSANTGTTNGGGIFNNETMDISNSTLSGNDAPYGGGFYNNIGTANISHSTFFSNTATTDGAGIYNNDTANISNSTLSGNVASNVGGAIYNNDTVNISNSTLSGNSATSAGGIYNNIEDTVNMQNSIITNSTSGGDCTGPGDFLSSDNSNLIDDHDSGACSGISEAGVTNFDTTLANNGGPTWTHALLAGSNAIDAVTNCTIISTSTAPPPNDAGAVIFTDQRGYSRPAGEGCDIGAFEHGSTTTPTPTGTPTATSTPTATPTTTSTPTITNTPTPTATPTTTSTPTPTPTVIVNVACDVTELIGAINTANGSGGATTMNLASDCAYTLEIVNNTTDGPNGLPSITSDITLTGNGATIKRSSEGGTPQFRIFHVADSSYLMLSDLTIANGDAGSYHGGGIFSAGTLNISHSTLSGNTATGFGGAIMNSGGTVDISNSTLSGNTASYGGGIMNGGALSISHSTFSGNTASADGGGIYGGTVSIKNTILAGNTPTNCDATMASQGYNLESGTDCGFDIQGQPGDQWDTDPKLYPLDNNGGPTQTHALQDGSPAIDAGSCTDIAGNPVTTDQRGYNRPCPTEGGCDIGAYEGYALFGDLDCDCDVDVNDTMLVADHWRCQSGDACYDARYDLDKDGDIDVADIMLSVVHWGDACE
jgi:CSLREA domain-containing protein